MICMSEVSYRPNPQATSVDRHALNENHSPELEAESNVDYGMAWGTRVPILDIPLTP